MAEISERPERTLVRRAVVPSLGALPAALVAGWVAGGPGSGASAASGILVVLLNFAAHGLSLAWASRVSIAAVQAVALGGFVVRLGAIIGLMFALDRLEWFSPLAFGLAVVPATLLLLAYEARLVIRGTGAALDIPADPAAVRGAATLTVREV